MAVQGAGLVGLSDPDHDAVRAALHHPQEQIGVFLLMGSLGAVALGIGHGTVHRQVVLLDIGSKFIEVLMVAGAVLLVSLIGGGVDGVEGVHTHTPLASRRCIFTFFTRS